MLRTNKGLPVLVTKSALLGVFGLNSRYLFKAVSASLFIGTVRSDLFSCGLIKRLPSLLFCETNTSSVLMFASSPILIPVCKRISMMAAILASSRAASLSARYSIGERIRGGLVSNLGWSTRLAGSSVINSWTLRKRKNVFVELSFLERD